MLLMSPQDRLQVVNHIVILLQNMQKCEDFSLFFDERKDWEPLITLNFIYFPQIFITISLNIKALIF